MKTGEYTLEIISCIKIEALLHQDIPLIIVFFAFQTNLIF